MPRLPRLLAGGALAALALALPGPAAHAVFVTAGPCGPNGSQTCDGVGQGVLIGTNTEYVAFTCTATAPTDTMAPGETWQFLGNTIAETGVSCYLKGVDDGLPYLPTGPFFEPGHQSTVANAGPVGKLQGYLLCIRAGYLTRGGAYYPVQGETCFSPVATDG